MIKETKETEQEYLHQNFFKNKKRIIFHIGLPKTGTTFLQQNVFPYLKNINYYDCVGQKGQKGDFSEYYNPCYLKMKDGINLVSDERITGKGFIKFPYVSIIDRLLILNQIYGNNIEIILVTRNKKELYKSLYKQYAKHMYGINDYETWKKENLDPEIKEYDMLAFLVWFLWPDQHLILDYSELRQNQDRFIQRICNFIGVDFPENYNRNKVYVSPDDDQIKSIIKINKSRIIPKVFKRGLTYLIRKNGE